MCKHETLWMVVGLLLSGILVESSWSMKQSTVSERHRTIQGTEFSHILRCDNGVIGEQYLVNGVPMEYDEYQKLLEQAHLAQLRGDDAIAIEKDRKKMNWQQNLAVVMVEKSIKQSLEVIVASLTMLEHDAISPYVVYTSAGAATSKHRLSELAKLVVAWQKQLVDLMQKQDMKALDKLSVQLATIAKELETVVDETMKNAIARCDDTLVLKQLLELVTQ